MNEYLIKVTTKQSLNTVKKHIEKKYKVRDGAYNDKKKEYIGATYVYQLPERGSCEQDLNHNIERLRDRLNVISNKTGDVSIYYGDRQATLLLRDKHDECELPNALIANKLNGNDSISIYENGFEFNITEYSIEPTY